MALRKVNEHYIPGQRSRNLFSWEIEEKPKKSLEEEFEEFEPGEKDYTGELELNNE